MREVAGRVVQRPGRKLGLWVLALVVAACGNTKAAGDDAIASDQDGVVDSILTSDAQTADGAVDTVAADGDIAAPGDAAMDGALNDADSMGLDVNSTCPGGANCPCKVNGDCDNNNCLESPDGHRCAIDCAGGACPGGFSCTLVNQGGGDAQYLCVPKWGRLCEPCDNSKLCSAALGNEKGVCIAYGGLEGSFCGSLCANDSECPTGYGCKDVTSVEGKSAKQCARLPDGDGHIQCPCDASAVLQKLATTCNAAVVTGGSCPGVRMCGAAGLSACTASPSATELCDGIDNDCNGLTDDVVCDDKNLCTDDACQALSQTCVHPPNTLICTDGNACTTGDVCLAGLCTGKSIGCDDQNPCTSDSCDTKLGCQHENPAIPCSDDNACTLGDTCIDGNCVIGKKVDCDDKNACTADTCDTASGLCNHALLSDNACTDGDFCTSGDVCTNGKCVGKPVSCDDNNPCTLDTCAAGTGCEHAGQTTGCDDGNPCTVGDKCIDTVCISGSQKDCNDQNGCTSDSCDTGSGNCINKPLNGAACNDGNACTEPDACTDTTCTGKTKNCDDSNSCTADSCDPKTGCTHDGLQGGCDDGNNCTVGDVCTNNFCVSGGAKNCDDNNACTSDTCDPITGECGHTTLTNAPCDDGNACTELDKCGGGGAGPTGCGGQVKKCDDSNICTDDTCETTSGCIHTGNSKPCDDKNACTAGDTCVTVFGISGCLGNAINATVVCDDSNACTTDSCTPATGCTYTPKTNAVCDDYNPCTQNDTCNISGVCVSGQNICGCTQDSECQQSANLCTGTLYCDKAAAPYYCKIKTGTVVTCDASQDGQCKSTACDPSSGKCVTSPLTDTKPCNADSTVCTVGDACLSGICTAGTSQNCDDLNPCTVDACDATTGCTHSNSADACSDGNACTLNDVCVTGVCQPGAPKVCVDGSVCTTDSCDTVSGGCVFASAFWEGKPCNADSSVCTINDTCKSGVCTADAPRTDCTDTNPCTDDACDPANGCYFTNNANACSDANACTVGDICNASLCVPGVTTVCNDTNGCTSDSCDKTTGKCVFDGASWEGTSCNADSSVCTPNDTCKSGICVADTPLACIDSNPCTDNSCDPAKGCVVANNIATCTDSNACTVDDVCANAACVPGPVKTCDDNKTCTTDSCDTTTAACSNLPTNEGGGCDDGTKCTTTDTCTAGNCAGSAVNCDDANPCTTDSCTPVDGCVHVKSSAGTSCSDGSLCTTGDVCGTVNGTFGCSGTAVNIDDGKPCTADACDPIVGTTHTAVDQGTTATCSGTSWCIAGNCKTKGCGDGFVNSATNEACDDANTANCDGCESCQLRSAVVFSGPGSGTSGFGAPSIATPYLAIDGDLTIEAWIKPVNFTTAQPIVTYAAPYLQLLQTYLLTIEATTGKLVFQHTPSLTSAAESVKSTSALTANVWTHVAAVVAGQQVRLYINGTAAGSGTLIQKRQNSLVATLAIGRSAPDIYTAGFNGAIDEVHIAAAPLYGASFTPPRRVVIGPATRGLWRFDEASGSSAADASGTAQKPAYNLTLTGQTWSADACYGAVATAGVCGDGAIASATGSFPGTEECDPGVNTTGSGVCQDCRYRRQLQLGGSAVLTTPVFSSFAADAFCPTCETTIELWAKLDKWDAVYPISTLFATTYPSGAATNGLFVYLEQASNAIVVQRDGASFSGVGFKTSVTIGLGEWHHYALELGWSSFAPMRLYVDGNLALEIKAADWDSNTPPLVGSAFVNETIMFGGLPDDPNNPGSGSVSLVDAATTPAKLLSLADWSGEMDEIRISAGLRYGVPFVPARRLVPDATTRGLWHLDAASPGLQDDSGQGVAAINTSPLIADDAYGSVQSAVCGDGARAPWEWNDGAADATKAANFPKSTATAGLACMPYWNADCSGISWNATDAASPYTPSAIITYPTLKLPTGLTITGGPWTWEGWVRLPALPASGKVGAIAAFDTSCNPGVAQAWAVQTNSDGTDASTMGAGAASPTTGRQVWKAGVWQHFALEYHGDGNGSLWVDGQKARSFTVTATAWSSQCKLRIGARENTLTNRIAGQMASLHMTNLVKYGATFDPAWSLTWDANTIIFWDFAVTAACGSPVTDTCTPSVKANGSPFFNGYIDIGASTGITPGYGPYCTTQPSP